MEKHSIKRGNAHIVNMWLDRYEEIFSDFDPSPFSQRLISDDFIIEAKKICKEKSHPVKEFNLYVPEELRNTYQEKAITDRMHFFFRTKFHNYMEQFKEIRRKGIVFMMLGIIVLAMVTYFLSLKTYPTVIQIIFIVTEPAGWFLIWMGLDYFFFISKERKPEKEFYEKIQGSKISFHSTPVQT